MGQGGVNGLGVAAVAAGALLVWSGIKGASVTTALRSLISGQAPAGGAAYPLTAGGGGGAAGALPAPMGAGPGDYSNSQLRALWVMAGGSPSTAAVAACIAQHESDGNAKVTSGNPDGGTNVGLWQLDTPGGKGGGYSVAQLQNPLTNARVAVKGSNGGRDWSAWATASMCGV